ncbi:hypothetical protein FF098_015095 [Parvularcula flava]|nr:hypothetical protein [Aquisalinus luteolus]NHK29243.1 hypothetical protein [Aquisalinus luteolus]
MADKIKEDGRNALSMDAIAEDLFGLNIRGLRSIFVLWVHPKRYFAAARTPDWGNRYTPSIRLWLTFFALFSALKIWWIGGNEGMIGAYANGFAQSGMPLPEGMTYEDIGKETVLWVFGLWPILQIISMVLLSLVYPFWGERTTMALRQRYFFAVIVPSASLMPVVLTIMLFVPGNMLNLYGMALAVVSLFVAFQTGYRGGFEKVSGFQKAWRVGLLAVIVVVLNILTNIIIQIVGILVISQKYGYGPVG